MRALKMKTRATERAVFCCEETRETLRSKRKEGEKFCFFSFVCLFLGKVIFRCIPLKTSSLILTKPSHNKNNSLSLSTPNNSLLYSLLHNELL